MKIGLFPQPCLPALLLPRHLLQSPRHSPAMVAPKTLNQLDPFPKSFFARADRFTTPGLTLPPSNRFAELTRFFDPRLAEQEAPQFPLQLKVPHSQTK